MRTVGVFKVSATTSDCYRMPDYSEVSRRSFKTELASFEPLPNAVISIALQAALPVLKLRRVPDMAVPDVDASHCHSGS